MHIIDSMHVGGAEKLLQMAIQALDGKYEQHLLLLNQPDTLAKELTGKCQVSVLDFRGPKDLLRIRRKIRRYIRENNIEIVHSHLYWSNVLSRLATPRSVKLVNTIHAISSEASYKINKASYYLEKLTYGRRVQLITVSDEVLKDFQKWIGVKGKARVLYNMIDEKFSLHQPRSFNRSSFNRLRLVAVGNLRWQKNYEFLLDAFRSLPEDVELDIYGEGDLRESLQKTIDQYKLPVRLCGHHGQIHQLLPNYDLFVMSSFYEGFSLGLMEAMAMGLPPVLSDLPVLKEAAGDTAFYFSLSSPAEFVSIITQAQAGELDLEEKSRLARERALRLTSRDSHIAGLIEVYNS